jgi:uncharacterized membrane protein YGL010W
MKPTLQRYFDDYADDHRHPMNRLTHKIAIPLIVFHVVAMLDWVKLPLAPVEIAGIAIEASLGHVIYLAAVAFYLALHVPLALVMALLMAACFPLGSMTPKPVVVGIAVLGWLVQLAGHSVFEKNRPAFLKNMLQVLIGPLFFVAVGLGAYRPPYRAPAAEQR